MQDALEHLIDTEESGSRKVSTRIPVLMGVLNIQTLQVERREEMQAFLRLFTSHIKQKRERRVL